MNTKIKEKFDKLLDVIVYRDQIKLLQKEAKYNFINSNWKSEGL